MKISSFAQQPIALEYTKSSPQIFDIFNAHSAKNSFA
jgi:hypothetical protein